MNHGHVLIKCYGHVWPAQSALLEALRPLLPPSDVLSSEEMLEQDKDLLRLCYEGLYFPLDEVLAVLAEHLTPESQGKVDYLDLEQWTLTRHKIRGKDISVSTVSLNHVLDYAGH